MTLKYVVSFILGISSICFFACGIFFSVIPGLNVSDRVWAGHEGSNSIAQILWYASVPISIAYFYLINSIEYPLTRGVGTFLSHCKISGSYGRLVLLISIALVILGVSGCATNVSIQLYDRYYSPSCYYKSPC
jgi:hypothetical protein